MPRKPDPDQLARRKFLQLSGAATLGGVAALAGCTGGNQSEETTTSTDGTGTTTAESGGGSAQNANTVVVGQTYDPNTLDPAKYSDITSMQVANNIFDTLTDYKIGTADLQPGLATDWSFTNEGKSIEFSLREGVQFHKGYGELTTTDVKAHFDRLGNPDTGSPQKAVLTQLGYEGNEVDGDYAFRLNFSKPASPLPFLLGQELGMIPSAEAVDEKGKDFSFDPIGAGPFAFEAFEPNTRTVLTAFEDYYLDGQPKSQKVEFRPIPEDQTAWSSFRANEIDIKRVNSAERLQQLQSRQGVAFTEATGLITRFVGFNHRVEPLDNRKVRQALNYAANSRAVVEQLFPGLSTVASSFMAPGVQYHTEEGVPGYEHNMDKARSLLEEAGYGDGFEITFWAPQISRFTKPAQVFQNAWSQLGIDVDLQIKEAGSYISTVIGSEHDVPIFIHSLGQDPVPDSFMLDQFHSSNFAPDGSNYWFYENEQVDAWLDEATSTTDDARREELFANVQRQTAEDAVGVWIDHEKFIFAMQDTVSGFEADPMRRYELETTSING